MHASDSAPAPERCPRLPACAAQDAAPDEAPAPAYHRACSTGAAGPRAASFPSAAVLPMRCLWALSICSGRDAGACWVRFGRIADRDDGVVDGERKQHGNMGAGSSSHSRSGGSTGARLDIGNGGSGAREAGGRRKHRRRSSTIYACGIDVENRPSRPHPRHSARTIMSKR